jgi:arginase
MPDDTERGWDPVVVPWHLDEPIPAFPVPSGAPDPVDPRLPVGTRVQRMIRLYQAVPETVAGTARPLLLCGDCTTALGAVAGMQRRHRDLAVVWLDVACTWLPEHVGAATAREAITLLGAALGAPLAW